MNPNHKHLTKIAIMKPLVFLFAILTPPAFAQASQGGVARALSADRPDATESPITVEPGRVQLESSLYDWSRDGRNDTHTWLTLHAKFGLTESVDFGLVIDSSHTLHDNLVLDISLRMGLNHAAQDVGMATGFTVRF